MTLRTIGNYDQKNCFKLFFNYDFSEVRRNKPCVHLLYGVDISVNAGNMMYFAPLHTLLKSNKYSDK